MLPWRLPVQSLSTPGGVRVCARTLFWHLAPLFPLCLVGRLNVCFRQLGMGASSLSRGPKLLCFALLCLSESAGWSPGSSLQKALGEWREG